MTREEAIEIMDKMPLCNDCDSSNFPYTCVECGEAFLVAMEALKQPEIVLCKDCNKWDLEYQKCTQFRMVNDPDFYCGDGKRRSDGE